MVMHSWSSVVLLRSKTGRRQETGHKGMKMQASEQELSFHNVYFIVLACRNSLFLSSHEILSLQALTWPNKSLCHDPVSFLESGFYPGNYQFSQFLLGIKSFSSF